MRINRCGGVGGTNHISAVKVAKTNKLELLKWAREEKKCEWNVWTINVAANHGNLKMVKYCVANECPIDVMACANAAEWGHLECLKYLRRSESALGLSILPNGRLKMVIFTYLNILLSVNMINIEEWACRWAAENGHLDCLEVLTRNRQSALELSRRTLRARQQPHRMCTIHPRQRLSSPTWLAIRARRVARARMRNRIRIIARVLKPLLHPCNTKRDRHYSP